MASLLLKTGSRIQATVAINKLSGAKPKPRLSFTQPGQEQNKKKSPTSWGLFELLRLLFPPFPGLQQASQGGELAAASAGRSVAAGDHGLWAHGGQSLYLLSCKRTKPGLSETIEVLKICRKTSKTHKRRITWPFQLHVSRLMMGGEAKYGGFWLSCQNTDS